MTVEIVDGIIGEEGYAVIVRLCRGIEARVEEIANDNKIYSPICLR